MDEMPDELLEFAPKNANEIPEIATQAEESILASLEVEQRLLECCTTSEGMSAFAQAFYFVRYRFSNVNFAVGKRASTHEATWRGLALNLFEEIGGTTGKTHNQLYRDFLGAAGAPPEANLVEPTFSKDFNAAWDRLASDEQAFSFAEALSAIAVYEVLDIPDYRMLLHVVKRGGIGREGQRFFEVHSRADHFHLFDDAVEWLWPSEVPSLRAGFRFVMETQWRMWQGLLEQLEQRDT